MCLRLSPRFMVVLPLVAFACSGFSQTTQFDRSLSCSKAARDFMRSPEWDEFKNHWALSHVSHYNSSLEKCFVSVRRVRIILEKNEIFEMIHVYDAIEGRIIGGKILTKKPINPNPQVINTVLLKGDRFIRDPAEAASVHVWFDRLMED